LFGNVNSISNNSPHGEQLARTNLAGKLITNLK
jgi:hypothetical protein